MRSVVAVRAFTNSQSAEAHFILFSRIFEIASGDTFVPVQFQHIHGSGFSVWVADAHKGQALGLGMFCESLCAEIDKLCEHEPSRTLKSLDPYDHLRRFFRLCLVHFKRHIHDLKPYTSDEVRAAMLSIASSEIHPDLEGAFRIINNGGKKAQAWLKDKQKGSKFAIPAIYQPASFIPRVIWKASPSSSNGNEQSHRNVNRDGVGLTILGGIMRGMQFDARIEAGRELFKTTGIFSRDQLSTHFHRSKRAVNRQVHAQRKIAEREASPTKRSDMVPTVSRAHQFRGFTGPSISSPFNQVHESLADQIPLETRSQESLHAPLKGLPISEYSELAVAFADETPMSRFGPFKAWGDDIVYKVRSESGGNSTHVDLSAYDEAIHASSFSLLDGALGP